MEHILWEKLFKRIPDACNPTTEDLLCRISDRCLNLPVVSLCCPARGSAAVPQSRDELAEGTRGGHGVPDVSHLSREAAGGDASAGAPAAASADGRDHLVNAEGTAPPRGRAG